MQPEEQFNQFGGVAPAPAGVLATASGVAKARSPLMDGQDSMETGSPVKLEPRQKIRRDVPRYVVLAGCLMPEATKRNFRSFQGWHLGGQWYSLSEIPCLWRHKGFITRGRLTPLIKRPEMASAAEEISQKRSDDVATAIENGAEVKELPQVYRMTFPYDSLQSLMSEHIARKGIVEVPALEAVEWDLNIVQDIQKHFFPNWEQIVAGKAEIPFLISDFEKHIEARMKLSNDDAIEGVGGAYLESADKFKVYAAEIVNKAKEAFSRGMNDKGYLAPVSEYAKHLAAQIGVNVEAQTTVVLQGGGVAPAAAIESDPEMKEIMSEANRLKRVELGLEPGIPAVAKDMPDVEREVSAAPSPDVNVVKCAATRTNGEPCNASPKAGSEFCSAHLPKSE